MTRVLLLVTLSFRNVFRNRRRSLFALTTIGVGAMGLFVFMGFNTGLMEQYRANSIRARWGHGQIFTRGYRGVAHQNPLKKWIQNPDAVMDTLRTLPGVTGLYPRVTIYSMLTFDGNTIAGQGEGIDGTSESRFFTEMNYVEGENLEDRPSGIVMGEGLAKGLGVHVGDDVIVSAHNNHSKIQANSFTVAGIFHTGSQEFDSKAFRIPIRKAQHLLGVDRVETIAVGLENDQAWPPFEKSAAAALPDMDVIPFEKLDKIYYQNAVDFLDAQFGFIRSIIVIVVFLSIFNVISMAVLERTAEVGTLRAHGDSRFEIGLGLILESAILGLGGGLLGIIAGWIVTAGPLHAGIAMPPAPGITRSFRIFIQLGARDAIQVAALSTLTAITGCLIPAWRTTRMPITEALRHI